VSSWVRFINGQVKRRILIDKYYDLKALNTDFHCKKEDNAALFVERIRLLAVYHDEICAII